MLSLTELCAKLLEGAGPVKTVLFRVDAGRLHGLSFGHLSRCILLSQTLRAQGTKTALLMRDIQEGVEHARGQNERVLPPTTEVMRQENVQVLVIDLPYEPEQDVLAEARNRGMWIVYLDDTGRSHIKADLVLNTSILTEPTMYPNVSRTLLGLDYFFMNPDDLALASHSRPTPDSALPPSVVMTFGGSDPTGLTLQALAALERYRFPIRLDVVLGPGFAYIDEVQDVAARIAARVLVSPPRLIPIFQAAELVICAGGRTLYECHALGIPALAVASTPNESEHISAFLRRGLLLEGLMEWNEENFVRALNKMLHTYRHEKRKEKQRYEA